MKTMKQAVTRFESSDMRRQIGYGPTFLQRNYSNLVNNYKHAVDEGEVIILQSQIPTCISFQFYQK